MEWLVVMLVIGSVLPFGAALWALVVHYKAQGRFSFVLSVFIGLLAGATGGLLVSGTVVLLALGLRALR